MRKKHQSFWKLALCLLVMALMLSVTAVAAFAEESPEATESTPTKGYNLTIYNADGTVGMEIDGTKSISAFSLKSAIDDARVFVDSAFLFGITTPATFVVEMYEDSTESASFEIGADVTINGNGHSIVLGEGVTLTNKGTLNDVTVVEPVAYVAEVNGVKYGSLQAAIDAAQDNDVIVIIANIELFAQNAQPYFKPAYNRESYAGIIIPDDKILTIDLAGYTISYVDTYDNIDNVMILNLGNLTINDSVSGGVITYKAVASTSNYSKFYSTIFNCGTLTVNAGRIENTMETETDVSNAIDNHSRLSHEYGNDSILVVNGGEIVGAYYYAIRQYTHWSEGVLNRVTINGGTIYGGIYMQHGDSWYYPNPDAKRLNVDLQLVINGGLITKDLTPDDWGKVKARLANPENAEFKIEINGGVFEVPVELNVQRGVYYTNGVSGATTPAEAVGTRNAEWLAKNGGFIKGGSFADLGTAGGTTDITLFIAEGYELGENGTVGEKIAYAAQIGNTYYKTLAEAIAAAGENDVIYVLSDVEEEFASLINVNFATNVAGGVTITNTADGDAAWIAFQNVTIGSGVTLFSENILTNGAYTNIVEGTLITGIVGTTSGTTYYQCNDAITIVRNGGKIVVNGDVVLRYNDEDGAGIFIYGDNDEGTVEFSTTGYIGAYSGAFYAENSVIITGTDLRLDFHDIKNGQVKGEEADKYNPVVAEFVNSTVSVTGQLRLYKDANLVLNNSDLHAGILQVRAKAKPVVAVDADSTLTADTVEVVTGAYAYAFRDDAGNVTFAPAVASIASTGKTFATLAEAIAAAAANDVITLLDDVVLGDTVTIAKSITIDGNGFKVIPADSSKTYNSAFMLGDSGWGDNHGESITIKNVKFEGWNTNYGAVRAQGVTLIMDGCEFTANSVSNDAYAVLSLNYAFATITNTKFVNNSDRAIDINYNADSSKSIVTIDGCLFEGNTTNGAGIIQRSAGEKLSIKNSKFIGNTVSTNGNAATVYLGWGSGHEIIGCYFENNTVITSHATTKRFASAIFCDGCTVNDNVFGEGNTATRNGETITTIVAVGAYYGAADINANYWVDGAQPEAGVDYTIEYTRNPVAITTYYTTYENGEIGGLSAIKTPAGKVAYRAYVTDSASREAIQIDLENVYAKETFVIKLYDANGNLLTTTTYRAGGVDAASFTCNIVLWGTESGSWYTEINADLTVANVPALVEIIADGKIVDSYQHESGSVLADKLDAYKALDCVYKAAKIGNVAYASLKDAFAALKDGDTLVICAGKHSEGTIQLPATLNNVTIKGAEGAILKDMVISTPDGNSYSFIGLTFDGITFENSYILLTGWRNGTEIIKDLAVTNCVFRNINNTTNTAAVHINKDAPEAVENFTFTGNVIDGALGGSKSGIYAQATGKVVITNNVINNVAFRPFVIQITVDDGIADEFIVTGNTFSGTAAGRIQGLGNNSEGTDAVSLVVNGNIFMGITSAQQICYWNFNPETTTADLSGNYYDIDIIENPSKIYYNSAAENLEDLFAKGIFPIYTELNADGTINLDSAYTPTIKPAVEIKYTNVTITENFKISFAFAADSVEDWTGYYVVITKTSAHDGSVETLVVPKDKWAVTTINGASYIVVDYAGVAAKEMSDVITATVYNADGVAVSDEKIDSIRDYAMRKLVNSTDAALSTLLVDMLNYGAEAQIFFGYATELLANAALTDEQKAFATPEREYSDEMYSKNYADGYKFNIGNTLSLEYNVQLKVGIDLRSVDLGEDAKIIVSYVNYKGETVAKEVSLQDYNYASEVVYVSCDTLTALDHNAQVKFELVDGDNSIVIFTNSVESFTARLSEGNAKADICAALMKYCDAAEAYFNK